MTVQSIEAETALAGAGDARSENRFARAFRTIFGRQLMHLAILLLLPMILSGLRNPVTVICDPDIWWHIANARILFDSHHFIHMEPYSFTVANQRWVDPEWLSEIPFWLSYKSLGLVGIYLVAWLGVSANVLFVYWRSCKSAGNPGCALWISAVGFVLMWVNASSRTILFGYLALSAVLAILEAFERGRSKVIWLLPPLFCAWINLHGSWIIGLALLTIYLVCGLFRMDQGIFQQDALPTTRRNALLAAVGASLVALMINPYGWRLIWNPFDMAFNQKLNITFVNEWQPLSLSWFIGKVAAAVIVTTILANVLHTKKWKIYELVFVFFAWYAAFNHARFTFLASIIIIPGLAVDLTRSFFPGSPNQKTIPVMNAVVAAGVLYVVTLYFPKQAALQKTFSDEFPLQTIAAIQPSWRTLHHEHLGGIMDFEGKPTFIDTRWDTFEHHGVMQDFIDILHFKNSLALLDKYKIDHVLLRKSEPLSYLLERIPGWKLVRSEGAGDSQYELFARGK
jgi:hypothetical protein